MKHMIVKESLDNIIEMFRHIDGINVYTHEDFDSVLDHFNFDIETEAGGIATTRLQSDGFIEITYDTYPTKIKQRVKVGGENKNNKTHHFVQLNCGIRIFIRDEDSSYEGVITKIDAENAIVAIRDDDTKLLLDINIVDATEWEEI